MNSDVENLAREYRIVLDIISDTGLSALEVILNSMGDGSLPAISNLIAKSPSYSGDRIDLVCRMIEDLLKKQTEDKPEDRQDE